MGRLMVYNVAPHEPSHLDLHCLHRCLFWSVVLKGLYDSIQTGKILVYLG